MVNYYDDGQQSIYTKNNQHSTTKMYNMVDQYRYLRYFDVYLAE